MTVGDDHACARRTDGVIVCWGYNLYGQVGDGSLVDRQGPVPVQGLEGRGDVRSISAGTAHTCAVAGGRVVCWGSNEHGALGNGAAHPLLPRPTPMVWLP